MPQCQYCLKIYNSLGELKDHYFDECKEIDDLLLDVANKYNICWCIRCNVLAKDCIKKGHKSVIKPMK